MTFGEKVALVRKQQKWTQGQLGQHTGTSGDMIGKYERDEVNPSIETAKRLADALEVSLDYLIGEAEAQILDKQTLKRLQQIAQLPEEDRVTVLRVIDALLRDAQTRRAYAA